MNGQEEEDGCYAIQGIGSPFPALFQRTNEHPGMPGKQSLRQGQESIVCTPITLGSQKDENGADAGDEQTPIEFTLALRNPWRRQDCQKRQDIDCQMPIAQQS